MASILINHFRQSVIAAVDFFCFHFLSTRQATNMQCVRSFEQTNKKLCILSLVVLANACVYYITGMRDVMPLCLRCSFAICSAFVQYKHCFCECVRVCMWQPLGATLHTCRNRFCFFYLHRCRNQILDAIHIFLKNVR